MITTIEKIFGEDASKHWWFLDVKDKVVLDLGSGRWYTEDQEEFTPMYFERMGASQVVAVDSDEGSQRGYFTETFGHNPKYVFIGMLIDTTEQIRGLIQQYKPHVIKMDIEGAEVYIEGLTAEDMSCVKEVGFEYHETAQVSVEDMKQMLIRKLREWGFSSDEDSNLDTGVLLHAKR